MGEVAKTVIGDPEGLHFKEFSGDRWLVYEEGRNARAPTETEQWLIDELAESRSPMSKTEFRDFCLECSDKKQAEIDGLRMERNTTRAQLMDLRVKYERMVQLIGGEHEDNGPDNDAGFTADDQ